MLEIKTITESMPRAFDRTVNEALNEGWELVRRECFITGSDRITTLYAELERVKEEPEEEEKANEEVASWSISRDPAYPYKCTVCGCKSHQPIARCPYCNRIMVNAED